MNRRFLLNSICVLFSLALAACGSSDNSSDGSQLNTDLPAAQNTGEPGGDTTSIAGLWNASTMIEDVNDLVYWDLASNGVLTRYDYQQDGVTSASGENCYLTGEPITVTPEGGDHYSIFDVAVTAVNTNDSLTITFSEADKNDIDGNGDTAEIPTFTWTTLTSPVLEDLNSCNTSLPTETPVLSPTERLFMTSAECASNGGSTVADIGDGTMFRPTYRCESSGQAPIANIYSLEGEPIYIEGAVCCAN